MKRFVGTPPTAAAFLAALLLAAVAGCAGNSDAAFATASPADAAAPAPAETLHAGRMADLAPDGPFPRFSPGTLAASGYPDHLHAFFWPGWTPETGDDGVARGPGALCRHRALVEDPGLEKGEGRLAWRSLVLEYNPGFEPCDVAGILELVDWGRERVRRLLDLEAAGPLTLVNADDLDDYALRTGFGNWRTFRLDGDRAVLEPVPILTGRTLVAHAAVDLAAEWTLRANGGDRLPPWLLHGLAAYVADMGPHYLNYMNYLISNGQGPALTPAEVDALLTCPPHADPEQDRWLYRRARYCSFLMVWHLVEEGGGLARARTLLHAVAAGADPDAACREVYGLNLSELAARLDPMAVAAPVPPGTSYPNPSHPPR